MRHATANTKPQKESVVYMIVTGSNTETVSLSGCPSYGISSDKKKMLPNDYGYLVKNNSNLAKL